MSTCEVRGILVEILRKSSPRIPFWLSTMIRKWKNVFSLRKNVSTIWTQQTNWSLTKTKRSMFFNVSMHLVLCVYSDAMDKAVGVSSWPLSWSKITLRWWEKFNTEKSFWQWKSIQNFLRKLKKLTIFANSLSSNPESTLTVPNGDSCFVQCCQGIKTFTRDVWNFKGQKGQKSEEMSRNQLCKPAKSPKSSLQKSKPDNAKFFKKNLKFIIN